MLTDTGQVYGPHGEDMSDGYKNNFVTDKRITKIAKDI